MVMAKRFEKKRVFVTAASVGIGYEICRQFIEQGAITGLNAHRLETTQAAVDKLRCTQRREHMSPWSISAGLNWNSIDRWPPKGPWNNAPRGIDLHARAIRLMS